MLAGLDARLFKVGDALLCNLRSLHLRLGFFSGSFVSVWILSSFNERAGVTFNLSVCHTSHTPERR